MSKNKGLIWPYAIGISIILIFGACVATIVVASKLPVEKSDTYMMDYHQADANANELIKQKISFNKKYQIEYLTNSISQEDTTIKYKILDKNGNAVNDANIKVIITRPNSHKFDQELSSPNVENGIYTFKSTKLAKPGRWDIMAKINIQKEQRYYNLKLDTRHTKVFEY